MNYNPDPACNNVRERSFDEINDAGGDAFLQGKGRKANPYNKRSSPEHWYCWDGGWHAAKLDKLLAEDESEYGCQGWPVFGKA